MLMLERVEVQSSVIDGGTKYVIHVKDGSRWVYLRMFMEDDTRWLTYFEYFFLDALFSCKVMREHVFDFLGIRGMQFSATC